MNSAETVVSLGFVTNVIDIEASVHAEYTPGDRVEEDTHVVIEPGGHQIAAVPMLWETKNAFVNQSHAPPAPSADIDYWVVPRVVVSGGGALVSRQGSYLFSPTTFPYYVKYYVEHVINSELWTPPEISTAIELPAAISILHFNVVFGHWITEIFPKLILLKYFRKNFSSIPIIVPSNAPKFILDQIKATLGDWPIHVYDHLLEHVEVETLILPGSMQTSYNFHPYLATLLDQYATDVRPPQSWWKTMFSPRRRIERVFISRSGINSTFRSLTNTKKIEDIAAKYGFFIVRPEELPWEEQVELFNNANYVVGEFGSGMHSALFSKRDTKVLCLNWIADVQSHIANYRGHRVGYLLPPDDQPRLFNLDGGFHEFEIDPQQFERALETMLKE